MNININADVGEGLGNEKLIMPFLNSCNIACGGHAGDAKTIKRTIKLAKKHNLNIGAHPSYPDRTNFGRVSMDISALQLKKELLKQLNLFHEIAIENDVKISHIKPHGALYHDISKNTSSAKILIEVLHEMDLNAKLVLPYKAPMLSFFSSHFLLEREAFIDRRYNIDLTLVSRDKKNAVILEAKEAVQQLVDMVKKNRVNTIQRVYRDLKADTFCIHGDHPNVLPILNAIHKSEDLT